MEMPVFWMGRNGSLLTDEPVPGAQLLMDKDAEYYGGRYLLGESLTSGMARTIADAFGGTVVEK